VDEITDVVNKLIALIDTNSDGQLTKEEIVTAINKDPFLKRVL